MKDKDQIESEKLVFHSVSNWELYEAKEEKQRERTIELVTFVKDDEGGGKLFTMKTERDSQILTIPSSSKQNFLNFGFFTYKF